MRSDAIRYGWLAAALHWLSAAAILALLALGFLAAGSADPDRTAALLRVHAPLGLLVLVLTAARLVWRFFDVRPAAARARPSWQPVLARANHGLLYGVVIVVAASGMGLVALSGALPALLPGASAPLPRFADFAPMAVHALGAFVLIGLLCLHVGAVLYHHVRLRDCPLARMGIGAGPRRRP